MTTMIVAGAPVRDPESYRPLLSGKGMRIAVDRGADLCLALGWMPDLFVGDGDSVSEASARELMNAGVPRVDLPVEKDVTDLAVALATAGERFPSPLRVTAVMGGRTDHLLVAIGDLLASGVRQLSVIEPSERAWVLSAAGTNTLTIAPRGALVSVLAGPGGAVVTLSGFKWNLARTELDPFSGRGLSNVIDADTASVTIHRGTALVHAADSGSGPAVHSVSAESV